MTGFRISGVAEFEAAVDKMIATAETAALKIVNDSEVVLEAAIKKQFTGAHPRGTPTTSSPGSPPDVVTGTLRRSITGVPAVISGDAAIGRVYPAALYARIQELGGTAGRGHAAHLPARPFVSPAYAASQASIGAIATKGWAAIT